MKSDKFLWLIVGVTLALLVSAVAIAFVARQQPRVIADDTPDGVAYNYFLALQAADQHKAYSYLSARVKSHIASPDSLFKELPYGFAADTRLRVDDVLVTDTTAQLKVTRFSSSGGGLFGGRSEYSESDSVTLVREDGAWKIERFFYPYWNYNWN